MGFKVGDKVKIRKGLVEGAMYGPVDTTLEMIKLGGRLSEISDVHTDSYYLTVDDNEYYWSDEMLEPAEESSGSSDEQPDVMFPAFGELDNGMPHTPHYMNGLIETIDVIKMALTPEEFKGFLKGNVLKYELRAPYKHETPDADYQKAKDYYDLLEVPQ